MLSRQRPAGSYSNKMLGIKNYLLGLLFDLIDTTLDNLTKDIKYIRAHVYKPLLIFPNCPNINR